MLKSINRIIKNDEFSINVLKDFVHINNFIEIVVLEPNKIVLKISYGLLRIFGNNLLIKKLLDKEIAISGSIKSIEYEEQ